ncbi:MAG: UvrD-helicase domain-containing protein [Christensenella sp.]|nr:UvrD-helicase domain-containing protein [Christensenella sp.]
MLIADLHIHSQYSRATSKQCVPEYLDLWARKKGIGLLGTGDFTHPAWRGELREKLVPTQDGFYTLKEEYRIHEDGAADCGCPWFVLSGEISSIYKQDGKTRKVHNVILLPSLADADALSSRLEQNFNLHSDGRPILGLSSHDLLEITLETCPDAIFIPAHIWTPHFSLFGAYSGFDSIEECFGDLTPHIHALETGLSSDPPMNDRVSSLDRFIMVSNSDAHSPANLGREANLLDIKPSYPALARALSQPNGGFCGTLEFFPEEGKYHSDGHRNCGVCMSPEETIAAGGICPVCGRPLTIGVLHRVAELADRPAGFIRKDARRFESIVPLPEVIACSLGVSSASKKAKAEYEKILSALGPEFYILRDAPEEDIRHAAGACVAQGIRKLRAGEVVRQSGFDGQYGKITVLSQSEIDHLRGQLSLPGTEALQAVSKQTKTAKKTAPDKESAVALTPAPQSAAHYGLNDRQWQAASTRERATAVLAGPGTGKTRTLICRIAYLTEHLGVSPSSITAVTFTNKAAGELRERLNAYFGEKRTTRAMQIGTFHSVCLSLLRALKDTDAVLDAEDALFVMTEALRDCNISLSPAKALAALSRQKNGLSVENNLPEVAARAYASRLSALGAMDYDDILLRTLAHFQNGGKKLEKLIPRFAHLLVDEFQDSNPLQIELLRAWGKHSQSVFAIGDPDQAVYGFRGSDPHCFEKLREAFAPLSEITLNQNYRSTPEILRCALPVMQKKPDSLHANRSSGVPVRLLTTQSSFAEAVFVAHEIGRLVGGIDMLAAHSTKQSTKRGGAIRGFSEIAVLYRTNRQAELLGECLAKEGIPYLVSGHEDWLADRRVRGALAFFRLLADPHADLPLQTYLKTENVPDACIAQLQTELPREKRSVGTLSLHLTRLLGENHPAATQLLTGAPLMRTTAPAVLIEAWMQSHGQEENEPMERLLGMALAHETMQSMLDALMLGKDADARRFGGKTYAQDAVCLLTLHAAKGLEFPIVFLCGAQDGLIPYHSETRAGDPAEERRLFYVGMTRAQEELTILTPEEKERRSPFLADIPTGCLTLGQAREIKKSSGKQISLF